MCRCSCTKWNRSLILEIIVTRLYFSINSVQMFKDSKPTSSYFKFAEKRTLPQVFSCKLSDSFQDIFFLQIKKFKGLKNKNQFVNLILEIE